MNKMIQMLAIAGLLLAPVNLMASTRTTAVAEVAEIPTVGFQAHVTVTFDGVDHCAAAGTEHWVPLVAGHEMRERHDDSSHATHYEVKGRAFVPSGECDSFVGMVSFDWTEYKPSVDYVPGQEGLTFDGSNFHFMRRFERPDGSVLEEAEDVETTRTLVCGAMFNRTICEGEFRKVTKRGIKSKETTRYNNRLLELWPEMEQYEVTGHGVFFKPTGRVFYVKKGALPDQPGRGGFTLSAAHEELDGAAPALPVVAEARANMPTAELPEIASGAGGSSGGAGE